MDTNDLDRLAFAGAAPPESLGAADTLYFLMLRALYAFAKQTEMTPEQGKQEKAKILDTVRTYRSDQELVFHCARVLTMTGAARADYRKARNAMEKACAEDRQDMTLLSIAAADRIVEALDNIPIRGHENGP